LDHLGVGVFVDFDFHHCGESLVRLHEEAQFCLVVRMVDQVDEWAHCEVVWKVVVTETPRA
jgi:hypothetical protein